MSALLPSIVFAAPMLIGAAIIAVHHRTNSMGPVLCGVTMAAGMMLTSTSSDLLGLLGYGVFLVSFVAAFVPHPGEVPLVHRISQEAVTRALAVIAMAAMPLMHATSGAMASEAVPMDPMPGMSGHHHGASLAVGVGSGAIMAAAIAVVVILSVLIAASNKRNRAIRIEQGLSALSLAAMGAWHLA